MKAMWSQTSHAVIQQCALESALLLQAMASPVRLRLLETMLNDELSIVDLQKITGVSQKSTCEHLEILRQTDIVFMRRDGNRVLYAVRSDKVRAVRMLIQVAVDTATVPRVAACPAVVR